MSTNATGPRTDAGKARSSQNAVKHGIFSQNPVIPGENTAEWDTFCKEIVQSHAPIGLFETELAERIALQLWRLRRVGRYEAELVGAIYAEAEGDVEAEPTLPERACRLQEALARVVRYEAHVGRQLKDAQKLLRERQEQRQALPIPSAPPAPQPTEPPAAAVAAPSSFCQTASPSPAPRRRREFLPLLGVSFADFDVIGKPTTAKT